MKSFSSFLLCLILFMLLPLLLTAHNPLITEVMADGITPEPASEWIEIFNSGTDPVCIDGWQVDDGAGDEGGSWTIPDPTGNDDYILYPGGYVVFSNTDTIFRNIYGFDPDFAYVKTTTSAIQLTGSGSLSMANSGDQAYLRNAADSIIDCMAWGNKKYSNAGYADSVWYPLTGVSANGQSYIRDPQSAEGTELFSETSEQLSAVWAAAGSQSFAGPNTGGLNPAGLVISSLYNSPGSPDMNDTVSVYAYVESDTSVIQVVLFWTVNDFSTVSSSYMTKQAGDTTLYTDSIFAYPAGTRVKYYVMAVDNGADTAFFPLNAPAGYKEYIVSDGSRPFQIHFNKSVDNACAVYNFAVGEDLLDTHLVKYIHSAVKTIDCCVYDLDRQIVADSLVAAHNRGVKVRFITDLDNRSLPQVAQLESAGIPVIDDGFPYNYAGSNIMHNKFFVLDTQTVFTGSWNITDNGTERNANNQIIIDDKIIAENYTKEFTEMWGSTGMTPDSMLSKFSTKKSDNIQHVYVAGGDTVEVYMSPSDGCASKLINAINTAQRSIYFCIFSFSSQPVADAMRALQHDTLHLKTDSNFAVRGVFDATYWNADYSKSLDMRGISNSGGTNNPWVRTGDVFSDSVDGSLLHHKYMLIDADKWTSNPIVVTGSYNWSDAAETGNDENMLIIHSTYFADMFLQEFTERYHEAGGTADFTAETEINATDFSCIRESSSVHINYANTSGQFERFEVDFEGKEVFSSSQPSGSFRHGNSENGVYSLLGVKSSGVRVMLAQSYVSKAAGGFTVVSQNRIFGSRKTYEALIKGDGPVDVKILNVLGEVIYKEKYDFGSDRIFTLNHPLSSGVYYVIFENGGRKITERIMRIR